MIFLFLANWIPVYTFSRRATFTKDVSEAGGKRIARTASTGARNAARNTAFDPRASPASWDTAVRLSFSDPLLHRLMVML